MSEAADQAAAEVLGVTVRLGYGDQEWCYEGITPEKFDFGLIGDFAELVRMAQEKNAEAELAGILFARRVLEILAGPSEARTIMRGIPAGPEMRAFVEQLIGAFPLVMGASVGEASASPAP